MRRANVLTGVVCAAGVSFGAFVTANAACTPTGFFVDGVNLTAAMINPFDISRSEVDATGCNIGLYYDDGTDGGTVGGNVDRTTISNANYFGIVVNGGGGARSVTVNVTNSIVTDIEETPPNGSQHGVAIFYTNGSISRMVDDSRTCSANADAQTTGMIFNNDVTAYQKNGIVAKCPGVNVTISGNRVTGAGPVDYIAQNGIEVGVGAQATVGDNVVIGNQYTGANNADASGVLVFGGGPFSGGLLDGSLATNEKIEDNTLTNDDVGIFSVNCGDQNCTIAPREDTNNIIAGNILSNDNITNVSGCGGTQGYQAGISEIGRNDKINRNHFSGAGYTPNGVQCTGTGTTAAIFSVDRSAAQGPRP